QTTAVRIHTSSNKVNTTFPLMFVVRQQRGLLSWQIPLSINYIYRYSYVARTLCPMDKNARATLTKDQLLYVDVSSMSKEFTNFTIESNLLQDFSLSHNAKKNVSVSPSEPVYFMYTFPEDIASVLVTVDSEDTECMVVSIQDIKCPVFDLDNSIEFQGKYQTMTKQAAIILNVSTKEDYDEGSFYLVMVVKSNDLECNQIQDIKSAYRSKTVSIMIEGTISSKMKNFIINNSLFAVTFYSLNIDV
ncbi:hypothetical protein LOTGIDRAFT_104472, partial [Lottia gigantea]